MPKLASLQAFTTCQTKSVYFIHACLQHLWQKEDRRTIFLYLSKTLTLRSAQHWAQIMFLTYA